jgi:hypothetical protein
VFDPVANWLIGFTSIPLVPFLRNMRFCSPPFLSARCPKATGDPLMALSAQQSISQDYAIHNGIEVIFRSDPDWDFLSWVLPSSAHVRFGKYVRAITLERW